MAPWIKAKFEGRDRVMARLRAMLPETERQLALAQMEAGQDLADAIRNRAPMDDPTATPRRPAGAYRRSINAARLADRPGRKSQAGLRQTKDPNAVGIYAEFIWRWLEFGTVKTAAQPHIFPTYRASRKAIRRKMAGAVNKAVRKARAR